MFKSRKAIKPLLLLGCSAHGILFFGENGYLKLSDPKSQPHSFSGIALSNFVNSTVSLAPFIPVKLFGLVGMNNIVIGILIVSWCLNAAINIFHKSFDYEGRVGVSLLQLSPILFCGIQLLANYICSFNSFIFLSAANFVLTVVILMFIFFDFLPQEKECETLQLKFLPEWITIFLGNGLLLCINILTLFTTPGYIISVMFFLLTIISVIVAVPWGLLDLFFQRTA